MTDVSRVVHDTRRIRIDEDVAKAIGSRIGEIVGESLSLVFRETPPTRRAGIDVISRCEHGELWQLKTIADGAFTLACADTLARSVANMLLRQRAENGRLCRCEVP